MNAELNAELNENMFYDEPCILDLLKYDGRCEYCFNSQYDIVPLAENDCDDVSIAAYLTDVVEFLRRKYGMYVAVLPNNDKRVNAQFKAVIQYASHEPLIYGIIGCASGNREEAYFDALGAAVEYAIEYLRDNDLVTFD